MRLAVRLSLAALLIFSAPSYADLFGIKLSPTADASLSSISRFVKRHRKTACIVLIAGNAGYFTGFYKGVEYTTPSRIVNTEHSAKLDDPSYAIVPQRSVYSVRDGEVYDSSGGIIAGSQGTKSILSFRSYLFRLSLEGELFVYRPRTHEWIQIESKPLKEAVALENSIFGITTDGELLEFTHPTGKLGFVGNEPRLEDPDGSIAIKLDRTIGTDFTNLFTQTDPGFYQPTSVLAYGEDVMILDIDGTKRIIKRGTPEREALPKP